MLDLTVRVKGKRQKDHSRDYLAVDLGKVTTPNTPNRGGVGGGGKGGEHWKVSFRNSLYVGQRRKKRRGERRTLRKETDGKKTVDG